MQARLEPRLGMGVMQGPHKIKEASEQRKSFCDVEIGPAQQRFHSGFVEPRGVELHPNGLVLFIEADGANAIDPAHAFQGQHFALARRNSVAETDIKSSHQFSLKAKDEKSSARCE